MQPADYEQALEAARRWIAEHRRFPQQREWEHRAPGRPTTRTIKRRWGWDQLMMAALGAGALKPEHQAQRARRQELLLALRRAHNELGRRGSCGSKAWRPGISSGGRRPPSPTRVRTP